jgi:hypothetical protein
MTEAHLLRCTTILGGGTTRACAYACGHSVAHTASINHLCSLARGDSNVHQTPRIPPEFQNSQPNFTEMVSGRRTEGLRGGPHLPRPRVHRAAHSSCRQQQPPELPPSDVLQHGGSVDLHSAPTFFTRSLNLELNLNYWTHNIPSLNHVSDDTVTDSAVDVVHGAVRLRVHSPHWKRANAQSSCGAPAVCDADQV